MSRPEAMVFVADGHRTGHLATVRPDGRPHVAPVWFVVDGDDLVFTTWHASVKAGNLDRNPRAAMSVDDPAPPYAHVVIEGSVRVVEVTAAERTAWAARMGARYMGAARAAEFGARNGLEGEWVVRMTAEQVVGFADMTD